MVIINMINGSIGRARRFDSTISIRATPSYSRATTFDFQHDESPADADDMLSHSTITNATYHHK
jgi:hypothetical protein